MARGKSTVGNPNATTGDAMQPQIVRANISRQTVTPADYVKIYTNDMQMQMTPWDVRLIFGQIVSTPSESQPTLIVSQLGEVSMSPQFAKKVAAILAVQIQHYERTVGAIPMPED